MAPSSRPESDGAMKKSSGQVTDPFSTTLLCATRNIHCGDWELTSSSIKVKTPVPFSVRKVTLHGGKQEGVELVEVDNGRLRITLIPTRGLGVLKAEMEDVRLGWDAPVKEVVHPHYVNLPTRGGLGWLDGFNEWLVRCGLENCGGPGRDEFVTNTGAKAEMDLWLHGKIANIPASELRVVIDRRSPHTIRVRGRTEERMFYGPKLQLWTELTTLPGANTFQVQDTVVNCGASEQEFQLLYHVNYGSPLLEAGARFLGPIRRVTPFNETAAEGIQSWDQYAGPTPGFVEQVYCLHPFADEDGRTMLMLQNAAASRAASISLAVPQLPYVSLWKSTAALEEGYVTGIEPGTSFPNTRRVEREAGRVPKLGPGESRRFTIDFGIHIGRREVAHAATHVARIQARHQTQVDERPATA